MSLSFVQHEKSQYGFRHDIMIDLVVAGNSPASYFSAVAPALRLDPEAWTPVFPRGKRGTRLRGDHAQTTSYRLAQLRE
jgi:hypothetical protein